MALAQHRYAALVQGEGATASPSAFHRSPLLPLREVPMSAALADGARLYAESFATFSVELLTKPAQAAAEIFAALDGALGRESDPATASAALALARELGDEVMRHPAASANDRLFSIHLRRVAPQDAMPRTEGVTGAAITRLVSLPSDGAASARGNVPSVDVRRYAARVAAASLLFSASPSHVVEEMKKDTRELAEFNETQTQKLVALQGRMLAEATAASQQSLAAQTVLLGVLGQIKELGTQIALLQQAAMEGNGTARRAASQSVREQGQILSDAVAAGGMRAAALAPQATSLRAMMTNWREQLREAGAVLPREVVSPPKIVAVRAGVPLPAHKETLAVPVAPVMPTASGPQVAAARVSPVRAESVALKQSLPAARAQTGAPADMKLSPAAVSRPSSATIAVAETVRYALVEVKRGGETVKSERPAATQAAVENVVSSLQAEPPVATPLLETKPVEARDTSARNEIGVNTVRETPQNEAKVSQDAVIMPERTPVSPLPPTAPVTAPMIATETEVAHEVHPKAVPPLKEAEKTTTGGGVRSEVHKPETVEVRETTTKNEARGSNSAERRGRAEGQEREAERRVLPDMAADKPEREEKRNDQGEKRPEGTRRETRQEPERIDRTERTERVERTEHTKSAERVTQAEQTDPGETRQERGEALAEPKEKKGFGEAAKAACGRDVCLGTCPECPLAAMTRNLEALMPRSNFG